MSKSNHSQKATKAALCFMFCLSGFCGLLYQTIWLRLAFAKFGVITPVVSLVVAIFMLGLGIGSWLGGKYACRLKKFVGGSAITLYGIVECIIGTGAFLVPVFFNKGSSLCVSSGEITSSFYLTSSACMITISILPFAIAMGSTYPIILEFLRERESGQSELERNFGLLYAANTAGAYLGAVVTIFVLVEMFGFQRVLILGAIGNFLIGFISLMWGRNSAKFIENYSRREAVTKAFQSTISKKFSLIVLFATGFCSMAMEVVWTRTFVVTLGTVVYSFASLLGAYLVSNWFGAFLYRINVQQRKILSVGFLLTAVLLFSTLPLLTSNPIYFQNVWHFGIVVIVLFSIMPFSAALGYLTPLLIDELSCDDPTIAGRAYAINILGCIFGPLLAGYLMLPHLGARISLIMLTIPLILLVLTSLNFEKNRLAMKMGAVFIGTAIVISAFFWIGWEEGGNLKPAATNMLIHRDIVATTISFQQDQQKLLAVNGQVMTTRSKITKYMAHLPLVFYNKEPKSILVICFGMGTSFRSALAWNSKVTVVELVPGVVGSFSYFHDDAANVLKNPKGNIVIDDGRRFLSRTKEKFDVIIIDPPPPLPSSASGLLYSREFFGLIKKHLNHDGILQQWFGWTDEDSKMRAMLRALVQEFPYVRMYKAIKDPTIVGYHFLASESPISSVSAQDFYSRLPERAKADLEEWIISSDRTRELKEQIAQLVGNEIDIDKALSVPEKKIVITDDYPYNEYYVLGRLFGKPMYWMP